MEKIGGENPQKLSLRSAWKSLKATGKIYQIIVHCFALASLLIFGAWGFYQLGFTNDKGGVDSNNRYLANYKDTTVQQDSAQRFAHAMQNYLDLAVLSKYYPENARLFLEAMQNSDRNDLIDRMMYAANMYLQVDSIGGDYTQALANVQAAYNQCAFKPANVFLVPWMNEPSWGTLKEAILKDKPLIDSASRVTGVESRLIVACLVGEQIRLFNSNREKYKQYLGPMKVLSVQSQFSLGVNGIKDFTAMKVESNLKNPQSEFYMGEAYEHILDFSTEDVQNERFARLTNYHNHYYSYVYTGCILHQTMLQWKRAGYDISQRPDILCTLFNLGFAASHPGPSPRCGGSRIQVNGHTYTFGVIGSDFYFSGELAKDFPIHQSSFKM